ncbi:hypothetical protein Taro_041635 [Colocasia esculenta]|uniref:Uncharacterized protein n=1 Tax=Colocasia esculenta TaxID=4460 RepID=A0A843WLY3_COLES|nr:hypothetical protein [Colocasia esculenta]
MLYAPDTRDDHSDREDSGHVCQKSSRDKNATPTPVATMLQWPGRPGGIQGVVPFGCEGRPGGIQGVVPFVCEGRPAELGVVASSGGLFTLRTEASPSSSYYDSFHQWFTLCYGAPPSPSYHSSFHQRFTLHSGVHTLLKGITLPLLLRLLPLEAYILHKFYLFTLHSGALPYYGPPSASYYRPHSTV